MGYSRTKQDARDALIQELGYPDMSRPISNDDIILLKRPVAQLAAEVQSGHLNPIDVLSTYTCKAIRAHIDTNCLTEILINSARRHAQDCNRDGPLAGVPVSLKDVNYLVLSTLMVRRLESCRLSPSKDMTTALDILHGLEGLPRKIPRLSAFSATLVLFRLSRPIFQLHYSLSNPLMTFSDEH